MSAGSDDETIKVWDIQSRQVLRTISAKGPVSDVISLPRLDNRVSNKSHMACKFVLHAVDKYHQNLGIEPAEH